MKITEKDVLRLKEAYKLGATHEQAAKILGVSLQTLKKFYTTHPETMDEINKWKRVADAKVEKSLYKKATGYKTKEITTTITGDKEKKVVKEKQHAPDTTAMIFWLKNRQPARWRDRQDVQFIGDLKVNILRFDKDA